MSRNKTTRNWKLPESPIKRTSDEKVIFVFYTFGDGGSWTYAKLPAGWWWVGSGSTAPVNGVQYKFKREEQFKGPAKTQDKTMQYLNKVFTKLKEDGVITMFKLRRSYLP